MRTPLRPHAFALTALFFGLPILPLPLAAADLTATYAWKPVKIGGGGWVTGLDINPAKKDLMYVRTDVSGAYRWNPDSASWRQVVTLASMPAGSLAYGKYAGVDSLVGAPKDPQVAYMAFAGKPYGEAEGQIYKSLNRGETWTATTFDRHKVTMEPNGPARQTGERLAVDPRDTGVVYFGSKSDGLWTTQDGGARWSRIGDVPAGTSQYGITAVVFDPNPATDVHAKTNVIYVTVDGGGVYRTADAGATWARISDSGPGNAGRPRDAEIGPDHTFYVSSDNEGGAAGSVWKYAPAAGWTEITPPPPHGGSQSYWDLAVDPTDARRLVVMRNGGKCFVSRDQGATWTYHTFRLTSPHIQWQGRQTNYFLSTGEIAFDPFSPGKLWFAEGFGVWWADHLTTPEIEWHSASEGIEEMCGNDVIAPPGGQPVAAMWDLGAFYIGDPDTYTAQKSHPGFMSAWALDWCAADPRFIAGVFRNHLGFQPHPNSTGYSTDGGRTWTRFPAVENGTAPAELDYGVIAVAANTPDKIVWAPAGMKLPSYTADRGATWRRSSFGGPETTGFNEHPSPQKPLCADRVRPDTFYFYRPQDGVYRSTDGGARFEKVGNPVSNRYNAILKSTPGHAGHLWFAEVTGPGLWRSTDGGATWSASPGLTNVYNVGLGKARIHGGYPTIFIAGTAGGITGIFRSTDEGKTWDQVCAYPLGITDWIDALDGDKEVFGKVYVGFAGAGFAYGKPAAP
ncbi:MAG TPA: sialidase [Rariglobus sp.]